jgi:hypothetical protein
MMTGRLTLLSMLALALFAACGKEPTKAPTETRNAGSPAAALEAAKPEPPPEKPVDDAPAVAEAGQWLRAFAPKHYGDKTDEQLGALDSIQLYDAPTADQLPLLVRFKSLIALKIWDDGEGPAPKQPVGKIDDGALKVLSALSGLQSLIIGGWNVKYTDVGLEHLTALKQLHTLNLSQAQGITDDGMMHLQTLPALKSLNISYTKISDEGLEHLLGIPTLKEVRYGWAGESRRWLARFKGKHPDRPFLR